MDSAKMCFESENVPWPINLGNTELEVRNIVLNFCRPQERERERERERGTRRLELALLGKVCCKVDVVTTHVRIVVRKINKIFMSVPLKCSHVFICKRKSLYVQSVKKIIP